MKNNFLLPTTCLLLHLASAEAAVVVSYDAGVAASIGVSGAADPASQGWSLTNAVGNQFSDGYDSGDGGWRTVDGTTAGPANYSQTLNGTQQTELTTAPQWVMSWTVALDEDALGSSGGFVDDYYLGSNQNNLIALIDLAADGVGYSITHTVNGSNEIQLNDGTTTFNTGIVVNSTFPNFATFTLTHDVTSGTAVLDYGAGTANISAGAPLIGGRNAVFFGAGTSGGQGSAVWNAFSVEAIPEPSTTALFGLAGLGLLLRRRA